ncbi:MAG: hypothetical protein R2911_22275 [Caldilineaceae bacterium]
MSQIEDIMQEARPHSGISHWRSVWNVRAITLKMSKRIRLATDLLYDVEERCLV